MSLTVHFILLLFCFTFILVPLTLFCSFLFCCFYIYFTMSLQSNGFPLAWNTSELPVDLPPTSRPSPDQGYWWLQIHLVKGLKSTTVSSIDSMLPPIPFYNIMGTVSVTLNQCAVIFYLVEHVPAVLHHLTFDIVDFLLHYGNGLCSFTCILSQFWCLYFCWDIKW